MTAATPAIVMPERLEEALEAYGADGALVPIAGATDLLVHWPDRHEAHDRGYLDLSHVRELRHITVTDEAITLGALTTYWDVIGDARVREELPILVAAARTVGAIQIQARGTWAGNIANASPAADGVPALMACDAMVHLRGAGRPQRAVALCDFFTGYKRTRREAGELITAISIPRRVRDVQHYEKVGARAAQTIAKVGVALTHGADGWRVVAASVAPTTLRCRTTEALLDSGAPLGGPGDLEPALASDGVAPIDDIRSTAAYRRTVLARILYWALRGVGR